MYERNSFRSGDVFVDNLGTWTVCYEGLSCCGWDVVTFQGIHEWRRYGRTLDRDDAYEKLANGTLKRQGQQELFEMPAR